MVLQVKTIKMQVIYNLAIKNVLLFMNQPVPKDCDLIESLKVRYRDYDSKTVLGYLESRSKAGLTHIDIINGRSI